MRAPANAPGASPVLMVLERERAMIPVSPSAFHVAQSPRARLDAAYRGALVVWPGGEARPIREIRATGLWGETPGRKLLSALTGARRIEVRFGEPVPLGLDRFRELVVEYLAHDRGRGDPYLPLDAPLDEVARRVRAAASFAEVFRAIPVPDPADCLDVL